MTVTVDAETTRKSMLEKAAWGERSISRMLRARNEDRIAIQDYFWTFLHASELIWFYFGAWCNANSLRGQAGILLDEWRESQLNAEEADAWQVIRSLRHQDVHLKPVPIDPQQTHTVMAEDGKVLVEDGNVLAMTQYRYEVEYRGVVYDAFHVCNLVAPILQRFISDFDTLRPCK